MKEGDKVTWQSQSRGCWTEKTGTVIREVPAGEEARQYVPAWIKKSHIKFDDVSTRDRVLVAVPAGKNGQITHYYCPNISMFKDKNKKED